MEPHGYLLLSLLSFTQMKIFLQEVSPWIIQYLNLNLLLVMTQRQSLKIFPENEYNLFLSSDITRQIIKKCLIKATSQRNLVTFDSARPFGACLSISQLVALHPSSASGVSFNFFMALLRFGPSTRSLWVTEQVPGLLRGCEKTDERHQLSLSEQSGATGMAIGKHAVPSHQGTQQQASDRPEEKRGHDRLNGAPQKMVKS